MRVRAAMRGFTLIELMVALAIAALLLLLGMPTFTTFLRNSEIRSTSESLINGLRAASTEAARQNRRVMFTLAGGNSASWAINLVNDPVDCAGPGTLIQSYAKEEAGGNSWVEVDPPNKLVVCFDGLGRIVNQQTAGDHIQRIDVRAKVCSEARPLRIIVDIPGKQIGLRMCDPNQELLALSPPDPRACRDDILPPC